MALHSTINKSKEIILILNFTDYFNTKLYTGNSVNNTAITGVGFAPDFVLGKTTNINRTSSITRC